MMKSRVLKHLFPILFAIPLAASATEMYTGVLKAEPRGRHGVHEFNIRIGIDVKDQKITGKLSNLSARKCRGPVAISGAMVGDALVFTSAPYESSECGRINFHGMRDGDAFVGEVPWHGRPVEMTFRPER